MKARTSLSGVLLAMCALAVIAIGWGAFFAPAVQGVYPIRINDTGSGAFISAIDRKLPAPANITVGDRLDLSGLSFADSLRLQSGYSLPGTVIVLHVEHAGRWGERSLTAAPASRLRHTGAVIAQLFATTIGELIVGLIAFRRPSVATAALVFTAANPITSFGATAQFSWLPDPVFTVVGVAVMTLLTSWPSIALIPFITRFPSRPITRTGRFTVVAGDLAFWLCGAFSIAEVLREPVFESSWGFADNGLTTSIAVLCWIFALLAITRLRGEDRRRIGWVIAGYAVSSIASLAYNFLTDLSYSSGSTTDLINAGLDLSTGLQVAFPIALGYAVLRHRVLDLGFVINRGLVYTLVTATVVVVVSLIDWLSGRLISESRLALAAEAAVTVALGVALNSIHSRVESLVERVFFRARHLAERKLHRAIAAIGYVTTQAAIDTVVTVDAADILGLRSAGVYHVDDQDRLFRCTLATDKLLALPAIDENSALVRTLRVEEKPLFIRDLPARDTVLTDGPDAPIVAVPIVARHTLVGIAVYGAHEDGTAPDPEMIDLLARLCSAAAAASLAVHSSELQSQLNELNAELASYRESSGTLRLGPRAVGAE